MLQVSFWTEAETVGRSVDIQVAQHVHRRMSGLFERNDMPAQTIVNDLEELVSEYNAFMFHGI